MRHSCNKCVIELCYKSLSIVCVSNTDPGMTLKHRDYGPLGPGRYNPMAIMRVVSGDINETQFLEGFKYMFSWNW